MSFTGGVQTQRDAAIAAANAKAEAVDEDDYDDDKDEDPARFTPFVFLCATLSKQISVSLLHEEYLEADDEATSQLLQLFCGHLRGHLSQPFLKGRLFKIDEAKNKSFSTPSPVTQISKVGGFCGWRALVEPAWAANENVGPMGLDVLGSVLSFQVLHSRRWELICRQQTPDRT
eukprot:1731264-Amphidinium_carterae.1